MLEKNNNSRSNYTNINNKDNKKTNIITEIVIIKTME